LVDVYDSDSETDADTPEWVVEELTRAGVGDPVREARELSEWAVADPGGDSVDARLRELVRQRAAGTSLERLLGRVRFRSVELTIGPGVFQPQPETAVVVQAAVDRLAWLIADGHPHPRCVDLCTGCGTIAVTVAREVRAAEVHAVELDPVAASWAERNARHNDVTVHLHQGDVTDALPDGDGSFDVVVSNPPYVGSSEIEALPAAIREHDPLVALEAGADGLDLIRLVERTAARLLRSGGLVIVEHSDRQGGSAPEVFRRAGVWEHVADHPDHDGLDRFVTATRI
jgi:release factor glutamine methyltransferase